MSRKACQNIQHIEPEADGLQQQKPTLGSVSEQTVNAGFCLQLSASLSFNGNTCLNSTSPCCLLSFPCSACTSAAFQSFHLTVKLCLLYETLSAADLDSFIIVIISCCDIYQLVSDSYLLCKRTGDKAQYCVYKGNNLPL